MGFYAFLEIENKKTLPICDKSRVNVGNPLASFLIAYKYYIIKRGNSPDYSWFANFESKSTNNLRILPRIIYTYSGDLPEEEILNTISEWQECDPSSNVELISSFDINNIWGEISNVIEVVNDIIQILPLMGDDTSWYVKVNTLPAFKSLQNILQKAFVKGGQRVRLHFE